tara:strand:+ start:579 stop:1292 length:714 start_codon:yes stop_codon:yes gene_type:complete
MKFIEETHGKYRYIVVEMNSSLDKDFLDEIEVKGKENSKKQIEFMPSGEVRDKERIIDNNIAGVLAENVVKKYLQENIDKFKIDSEIIPSPFVDHETHIDIKIRVKEKIKTIEVRSSFQISPKLTMEGILTRAFKLIGRYTTNYKKKEDEKDFYITVIHRYKNEEIRDLIKNNIKAYIIGGGSKESFNKYGVYDNKGLKQGEACYRVIKPIISAPKDTVSLFKDILEIKHGKQQTLQ